MIISLFFSSFLGVRVKVRVRVRVRFRVKVSLLRNCRVLEYKIIVATCSSNLGPS